MQRTDKTTFIGRYYHALEQKGRLSIPVSFRALLGKQVVITAGLEGCLFVLTHTSWQQLVTNTNHLLLTKKAHRDWTRYLANNAMVIDIDAQGRILIPEFLKDHAHLSKTVVVVGSVDRIELWDQSIYHRYYESLAQAAATIAESIETIPHD